MTRFIALLFVIICLLSCSENKDDHSTEDKGSLVREDQDSLVRKDHDKNFKQHYVLEDIISQDEWLKIISG